MPGWIIFPSGTQKNLCMGIFEPPYSPQRKMTLALIFKKHNLYLRDSVRTLLKQRPNEAFLAFLS